MSDNFSPKVVAMKTIVATYMLRHSPDYAGDQFPWHWYTGHSVTDLHRCSSHPTEGEALEYLAARLSMAAQEMRGVPARRYDVLERQSGACD